MGDNRGYSRIYRKTPVVSKKYHFMVIQYMANCCCKGKDVRSRSDRDREVKLSWAHTVTLIHTDINFRVTESVAIRTLAFQR